MTTFTIKELTMKEDKDLDARKTRDEYQKRRSRLEKMAKLVEDAAKFLKGKK